MRIIKSFLILFSIFFLVDILPAMLKYGFIYGAIEGIKILVLSTVIVTVFIPSVILLLFLIYTVICYITVIFSHHYKIAKTFILENHVINQHLQKISTLRLRFFGYHIRYERKNVWVELKIAIKGLNGKSMVSIAMERVSNKWDVAGATFEPIQGEYIYLGRDGHED